jgi:two-component system, OmpR family, phosphate regulon response regulator PhoB
MVLPNESQNRPKKILIIEDEESIADLIAITLQSFDLNVQIDKAASVESSLTFVKSNNYDAIIVDWMLPGIQGIDFTRQIKQQNVDQMILMVTAKSDPDSIVQALDSGVDDYVTKPFEPSVLNARLKNLLKRAEQIQKISDLKNHNQLGSLEVIELNGLKIDYGRVELDLNGNLIHLTPSEFKLLGYLLKSQGRVLSRDQLIDLIQGEDVSVTGRTIDTHVFALRKKLADWADHIETIRGVGYRVNYSK